MNVWAKRKAKANSKEKTVCWGRSKREKRRIHATNTGEFLGYSYISLSYMAVVTACIDSRDCLCNLKFLFLFLFLITFSFHKQILLIITWKFEKKDIYLIENNALMQICFAFISFLFGKDAICINYGRFIWCL